jgi:exonuclease SbcC
MRPHRLRVQAFGAFATTEEVSFDDLEGLFLLHGETGAGKTTLLDAIAFALYGEVPGERGKTRRLRSDHAAPGLRTEVELEVTIGGRRLRITRKPEQERPKKSGTGMTTEQASVLLAEATPAGGWEVKSTRVGEADAEIADLMGMSSKQFFQVVLLPQGGFAQFLHAPADARERLLQKLFGTDRFAAVEEWLAERRRATAAGVVVAAEGVDRLLARVAQAAGVAVPEMIPEPEGPGLGAGADLDQRVVPGPWQAAWAADLAASAVVARDEAAKRVDARKRDLEAALTAQRQADQLADRQRRRRDALDRQAMLEAAAPEIALLRAEADAAAQAAEVAPLLTAADRAAADAEVARQAEVAARAAIPGDAAADAESACQAEAAGRAGVPAIPGDAAASRDAGPEALRAAAEEQRARLGRLDILRAIAEQAASEDDSAAAARAQAATIAETLSEAQAEATGRQRSRPLAEAVRDAASAAAAQLPAAQSAADAARRAAASFAELAESHTDRGRAAEAHRLAADEANALNMEYRRVRQTRIDGMRAELAKELVDGAPCPVCGSLNHPELCELPTDWVSREAEEGAYAAAGIAAEKADEAGREVVVVDTVIADLVKRLAEAGCQVPRDAVALAARTQQAEADANRLEAETSRLKKAAAGLSTLQRALDDLDAAIADDTARLTGLAGQHTAALAEADAADRRAADRRTEVRAQLGGSTDVDTAVAAASRLAAALTGAADAAEGSARTAAEAHKAAERAIRAATDAGFGADSGAVPAARAAFREARWRAGAADRIRRHEAEAEAVANLLADSDLAVELDPSAPVAEAAAEAGEAQQAHDAANSAHGEARHTAEQLAVLKPRLEDALATLEPLRARAEEVRQLADLAEGRGANQYKMTLTSFVLAARLEEVAQAASERLLTMTSGRYSLVHTDARRRSGAKSGLGLLACDAWTGVDRDTSTLSGGETFLASLALALGLADVVTAEAAGTPMEALFVDEGFGTLDEDTLDEVMNVLDGLRAGGRIVGIVSHVAELRQRIPAQVHVRKGHHGSHVTVTAG